MLTIVPAKLEDVSRILPMMQEFYLFEQIPYEDSRARRLLEQLIGDVSLGRVLLLWDGDAIIGYMVIGFGFSIEFGGRNALLDELFILPGFRGRGYGSAAIARTESECKAAGIEVLHLEADHFNTRAHDLYLRLGFKDHKRHLMTKWLR
jgi:GNAT superfamily N-acetyltransferase